MGCGASTDGPSKKSSKRYEGSGSKKEGTTYTMAEVGKHNKVDDVWIVLNKKVYDMTRWQHQHPGGALLFRRSSIAGKDCTEVFELYHTGQHLQELAQYCIGVVESAENEEKKEETKESTNTIGTAPEIHEADLPKESVGVVDEGKPKEEEKKEETTKEPRYTMVEVAQHNKPDDLWIVLKKKVYDVTQWQHKHPGGALCFKRSNVAGKDCTEGFGLYHSAKHEADLPTYCVGVVDDGKPKEEEKKEETTKEPKYTMAEVAQHNKPDDLWIVLREKVYDCTKWQHQHPGGALCFKRVAGKDCTEGFGLYHTERHEKDLPTYYVGVVDEGVEEG